MRRRNPWLPLGGLYVCSVTILAVVGMTARWGGGVYRLAVGLIAPVGYVVWVVLTDLGVLLFASALDALVPSASWLTSILTGLAEVAVFAIAALANVWALRAIARRTAGCRGRARAVFARA